MGGAESGQRVAPRRMGCCEAGMEALSPVARPSNAVSVCDASPHCVGYYQEFHLELDSRFSLGVGTGSLLICVGVNDNLGLESYYYY